MLDITYGDTKNSAIVNALVESLQGANLHGDLYIGYPILGGVEGRIEVDALLLTREHGLVAIDLQSGHFHSFADANADELIGRQDAIYVSLENKLKGYAFEPCGSLVALLLNCLGEWQRHCCQ